eukprot:6492049-Amphidinium_carterae.4
MNSLDCHQTRSRPFFYCRGTTFSQKRQLSATSSSIIILNSSFKQPMEVGQPLVQSSSTTFTPSGPTGMPIPSDSPEVRPPPGLEDQQIRHRIRTQTSYTGPESVLKRGSDTAPEDLQIQSGAASQERFNAMESVPEEVTHDEMEKETQKITSEVILQDFYVDADAVDSEKLEKVMIKKIDNLRELKVFTDVDVESLKSDERSKIIDSRWVISERPGPDGTSDLKARLAARGFSQFIEDPDLIYAATPRMSSLKLLLTVAAQKQWKITVTDIQAAFLNALVDVTEVIHVKPPKEFYSKSEEQSKVWRLKKALYGLKNSPKMWQKHLVKVLEDQFRMSQLKSDACVFKNQSESMFILSFVDDLLIIGEESEVSDFITNISKVFNLKHTTPLSSGTLIQSRGRKIYRRSYSVIEVSMMDSFMKSVYELYGLQKSNSVPAPVTRSQESSSSHFRG